MLIDLGSAFGNFDRPIGRIGNARFLSRDDVVEHTKNFDVGQGIDQRAQLKVYPGIGWINMFDDCILSRARNMHLIDRGLRRTARAQRRSISLFQRIASCPAARVMSTDISLP